MTQANVQRLLKENESVLLRERRQADRMPFVRPLVFSLGRSHDDVFGFTRDISAQGVGVISPVECPPRSLADLKIHSLSGTRVVLRAETRWCHPYGKEWFVVGFVFR